MTYPRPGDRVMTPSGPGTVKHQRMAEPDYTEPEAFYVRLDARAARDVTYTSTVFPAHKVTPLLPSGPEVARDMREWQANEWDAPANERF